MRAPFSWYVSSLLTALLCCGCVLLCVLCMVQRDSLMKVSVTTPISSTDIASCGLFRCSSHTAAEAVSWALEKCDSRKTLFEVTRWVWVGGAGVLAVVAFGHLLQGCGCTVIAPSMRAMQVVHSAVVSLLLIMIGLGAALYLWNFPQQSDDHTPYNMCVSPLNLDGTKVGIFTFHVKLGDAPILGGVAAFLELVALCITSCRHEHDEFKQID